MSDKKETVVVRLKPYDKKRGLKLQRLNFRGVLFLGGKWYEVAKDLGDQLKEMHQVHDDDATPMAFDVVANKEAAKALEQKEAEALEKKAQAAGQPKEIKTIRAVGGGDLSTKDLPRRSSGRSR